MAELTKEELLEGFIEDLKDVSRAVVRHTSSIEEATDLMLYSFLTLLDGKRGFSRTPTAVTLVITGTPKDDIAYCKENDRNWVREDTPINEGVYLVDLLRY